MIPHHKQMPQPQSSLKQETLHQNLCQQIDWKHFYKCKDRPLLETYFKVIVKWKSTKHEADLFIHIKGLLYKHVTDLHQKFLALVIPKAWKYTVLVEAHSKLGHQGSTQMYCPNKMALLLERNEKRYKEIHHPMCPLPQRKSKSSGLLSTDDRYPRMSF